MNKSALLALFMVVACAVAAGIWWSWRRAASSEKTSLLDIYLLWPLIFRADRRSGKRTRRGFVVLGVLVGIALIAADMFVNGRRGH
jgi:hypothetical protein